MTTAYRFFPMLPCVLYIYLKLNISNKVNTYICSMYSLYKEICYITSNKTLFIRNNFIAQKLTWEKYAGRTQRWSSKREHWTRSSNSKRSCVVPLKRSGLVVSNGGDFGTPFGWLPATHAPTCWRL